LLLVAIYKLRNGRHYGGGTAVRGLLVIILGDFGIGAALKVDNVYESSLAPEPTTLVGCGLALLSMAFARHKEA
jgi:hypothetical protein